jgi:hypothetical protein
MIESAERERIERENCPACRDRRVHSPKEWENHPGDENV